MIRREYRDHDNGEEVMLNQSGGGGGIDVGNNNSSSTDKKNSLSRSIFEMNTFGDSFNSQRMKEILQMDKIDELFETR